MKTAIDWYFENGFVMIEKSCHTCEHGIYENKKEVIKAMKLNCEKIAPDEA